MYGSTAEILWDGEPLSLRVNLPGAHQLTNALTAAHAIFALRQAGIRVSRETVAEGTLPPAGLRGWNGTKTSCWMGDTMPRGSAP